MFPCKIMVQCEYLDRHDYQILLENDDDDVAGGNDGG